MAPAYQVENHELCTELESSSEAGGGLLACVPLSKPWCCAQESWNVLESGTSGISPCRIAEYIGAAPNEDPCAGETNWDGKLCF